MPQQAFAKDGEVDEKINELKEKVEMKAWKSDSVLVDHAFPSSTLVGIVK